MRDQRQQWLDDTLKVLVGQQPEDGQPTTSHGAFCQLPSQVLRGVWVMPHIHQESKFAASPAERPPIDPAKQPGS